MKNWGYDRAGNNDSEVINYKQTTFTTDLTSFFTKEGHCKSRIKNTLIILYILNTELAMDIWR
jgi:hypothetical protein